MAKICGINITTSENGVMNKFSLGIRKSILTGNQHSQYCFLINYLKQFGINKNIIVGFVVDILYLYIIFISWIWICIKFA